MYADAQRESRTVPDPRAEHFWDADASLGRQYASRLKLPAGFLAWDVYFIFPAGVRWENEPPQPAFWMHQLPGAPPELRLDGEKFAQAVQEYLAAADKTPRSLNHRLNRPPHGPGVSARVSYDDLSPAVWPVLHGLQD